MASCSSCGQTVGTDSNGNANTHQEKGGRATCSGSGTKAN